MLEQRSSTKDLLPNADDHGPSGASRGRRRFARVRQKARPSETSATDDSGALQPVYGDLPFYDVAQDVLGVKTGIANVFFIGAPGSADWVLVDAGVSGCTGRIVAAAERRFGKGVPPKAILLTHGHFDHIGCIRQLLDRWNVPVYAHSMELPYLTGRSSYPPPDPSVGGGAMAWMSAIYPKKPIDLGNRVKPLPEDGSVPHLSDWRWIHTPGHTAGHVSFFRDEDRTLIVGDAFVTVRAESLMANITLTPTVHRPPAYFTPDWPAARLSIEKLAMLEPEVVATGHGVPLRGEAMRMGLKRLAFEFERIGMPRQGRYHDVPALTNASGVVRVPPRQTSPMWAALALIGIAALGFMFAQRMRDMAAED
jgi:glyoxylase-like metal-dependent hydrolase (beta-lactamase superfamily II)